MALLIDTKSNPKREWVILVGANYLGHKGRYNNIPTWVKTEDEAATYATLSETYAVVEALALDAGLQHLDIFVIARGVISEPPPAAAVANAATNVVSLFKR